MATAVVNTSVATGKGAEGSAAPGVHLLPVSAQESPASERTRPPPHWNAKLRPRFIVAVCRCSTCPSCSAAAPTKKYWSCESLARLRSYSCAQRPPCLEDKYRGFCCALQNVVFVHELCPYLPHTPRQVQGHRRLSPRHRGAGSPRPARLSERQQSVLGTMEHKKTKKPARSQPQRLGRGAEPRSTCRTARLQLPSAAGCPRQTLGAAAHAATFGSSCATLTAAFPPAARAGHD